MTQKMSQNAAPVAPEEALRLLNEAWSYYTPMPRLVTARSGEPSPVIEEYYAA
ncbi:hypothetical protein [uncultured Marivita sp.]|uniref:hypothetical protein n=1 Tax=uncultured Marivita sp. TaxID=888080 RepID=UPI00261DF451|nr:hypothetical protein [uncultured Marivita sp.]